MKARIDLPQAFDFWHPVARAADVKARPYATTVLGLPIVVFRPDAHRVAALHDVCPHRGMRLSSGSVQRLTPSNGERGGGRLVCPYHGYAFNERGEGTVPSSPKRTVCGTHFEAVERCGAIWIRRPGANTPMPPWTRELSPQDVITSTVNAPLLLVMDNFTEVEHTPTTHRFLGYRAEDMPAVTCKLTLQDDAVRVTNVGPQKPLPSFLRALLGTRKGDLFVDDWTTRFEPPHAVYDHFWRAPDSDEPRPNKVVTVVHFTPVDPHQTRLLAFVRSVGPRAASLLGQALLRPITRALVQLEVEADRKMLESLADHHTELRGRQLSRFDKALAENRRRLSRLYRWPPSVAGASSRGDETG